MDNKQTADKKSLKSALSIVLPGIVLFLCAMLFTPSFGVFRTIPFFIAGGAVSVVFCTSDRMIYALTAVMTLCTYLASGRSVGQSVLFAVVACLLSAAGVYTYKFVTTGKKTDNKNVRKKCTRAAFMAVVLAIVLSVVFCGNIVSFVMKDAENTRHIEYVKDRGGADMHKQYTAYEAFAGEYRTYVTFEDEGGVYGNADEFSISKKGGVLYDGVREYFEEKLLYAANAQLASVVSGATWGFNITASDIDFEDDEVIGTEESFEDYADRICYVVSFDSLIGEAEQEKFASVCKDTVSEINKSGISFNKIILCGGNATEVLFSLTVTPGTDASEVENAIEKFDEETVKPYGVTEMTILDYWKNR